jgi:translation initiation factor 2 beta subunit (eIF-2beta)/eIF-5
MAWKLKLRRTKNKHTIWENPNDLCNQFNINIEHLRKYLVPLLQSNCIIINNELYIDGRFVNQYIKKLLEDYMMKYLNSWTYDINNFIITQ